MSRIGTHPVTCTVNGAAADVMTFPVVVVGRDATLWHAWTRMFSAGVRHIVVAEDGRCYGVVDDREIVAQWPLGPVRGARVRMRDLLTADGPTVTVDASIPEVARAMITHGVDAVPVLDGADLVGLVTRSDLMLTLAMGSAEDGRP